jgi:hypothetical protein
MIGPFAPIVERHRLIIAPVAFLMKVLAIIRSRPSISMVCFLADTHHQVTVLALLGPEVVRILH